MHCKISGLRFLCLRLAGRKCQERYIWRSHFGWIRTDVKYTKTIFPQWVHGSIIPQTFNWKTDLLQNDLMIGVLKASDGSCSHADTIQGNLRFDATETAVLPLCERSTRLLQFNSEGEKYVCWVQTCINTMAIKKKLQR